MAAPTSSAKSIKSLDSKESSTHGTKYSAQNLKERCREVAGASFYSGFFTGLIMGVGQFLVGKNMVCVPEGVSVGQAIDVVVKYLKDHPEEGHYSASGVTEIALIRVWPCE